MNNEVVKEALSYEFSVKVHKALRESFKAPHMVKSLDEDWNIKHGTDTVDIVDCAFSELPINCQEKYLKVGRIYIEYVFDRYIEGSSNEDIATKFNRMVSDFLGSFSVEIADEDAGLLKFGIMTSLLLATTLVSAYFQGEIDIEGICKQYNIGTNLPEKRKLNKH